MKKRPAAFLVSREYPTILAPIEFRIKQSQLPLKPVCPVINTFFFPKFIIKVFFHCM